MQYSRILKLVQRSVGALVLLGSVGVSSDSVTFAQDASCATPAPAACQPQCCDDIYKRAGERLAQQLQQMNCQSACATSCAAPAEGCAANGCAATGCANGCGDNCGCGHGSGWLGGLFCDSGEPAKDPWTVMSLFDDDCGKNCLKEKNTTVGGWVQFGYQNHPDGSFTGNGPFLSQHEHNRFNLNQMYVYIAKVADGTKGFDWGYRADLMYGVDGNEAQSFGNINPGHWDYLNGWDHGSYEWAMPQLYGEVAMGDLSIKAGHFYTPIGYEVVTSPDNFFLSRQITFYNSEPFTHTGALATYKANDKLTIIAGYEFGWDTGFYQFNSGSMGIIGATYAATDKTTLTYAGGYGEFGWRGTGAISSFILSHKWTDKILSVHQFDALNTNLSGANFATNGVAGDSTGLINYLFYEVNTKVKVGSRQEWYKADGISYYTWTYGVNVKPTANLTVRPEIRHNWSPGGRHVAGALPGINGVYGDSTIFGVDAIFKF